jgi:hypothetical protein
LKTRNKTRNINQNFKEVQKAKNRRNNKERKTTKTRRGKSPKKQEFKNKIKK